MERIWRYEVTEEKCIENYLRENLGFTKHQIRALKFRENGIQVNGVRRRVNYLLEKGMCLELFVEESGQGSAQIVPRIGSMEILYEDEDVLVVNKPSGILVHPSGVHYADTLVNQLAAYFLEKGQKVTLRPIGRLDKDTSGTVLFAKNQLAAAKLSEDKAKGGFEKEYLALVQGIPQKTVGKIDAPIGRIDDAEKSLLPAAGPNTGSNISQHTGPNANEKANVPSGKNEIESAHHAPLKMQIDFQNGKEARTAYQVLKTFEDCALVRVRIDTGRTHQIRVHMAYIGHPLLGDPLYGRVKKDDFQCKENIPQSGPRCEVNTAKEAGLQREVNIAKEADDQREVNIAKEADHQREVNIAKEAGLQREVNIASKADLRHKVNIAKEVDLQQEVNISKEAAVEGEKAENTFNHGFHRAALHAARLTFRHPFSGEFMEVEAPLPADFEEFIGRETGWPDSHFNPQ